MLEHFRDLIPATVGVCDISAVSSAEVVLVAIPATFYSSLPVSLLADKIVVDVSNRNKVRRAETEESQAEQLAKVLPFSRVVKSFNVLSAYSLGKFKLNAGTINAQTEHLMIFMIFCFMISGQCLTFNTNCPHLARPKSDLKYLT